MSSRQGWWSNLTTLPGHALGVSDVADDGEEALALVEGFGEALHLGEDARREAHVVVPDVMDLLVREVVLQEMDEPHLAAEGVEIRLDVAVDDDLVVGEDVLADGGIRGLMGLAVGFDLVFFHNVPKISL